jgi:protein O-mannosyl-transferase
VYAGYFGLPLVAFLARGFSTGAWLPAAEMPRLRYLFLEWAAFPGYLLRQVLPFDPALYRGHGGSWPPSVAAYGFAVVTAAIVVAAVALRLRWVLGAFAVFWLGAALLPSSSLVPLGEPVADHRAYLGGAMIFLSMASGIASLRWRLPLTVALLLVMAGVAMHYEWVLMDPVRAWEDAVSRAEDSSLAWRSLAEAHAGRGDKDAAEEAFITAIRLATTDARSWTNLAVLYGRTGRLQDAERALRQAAAVALPAERGQVLENLGIILMRQGRDEEAAATFDQALAAQPARVQPRLGLAQISIRRGDTARARVLIEAATRAPEITREEAEWIERLRRQT